MLHLRMINYLRSCNNESSYLTSTISELMWDIVSSSERHRPVCAATLRDIEACSDSPRCMHCTRGCLWRLAARAIHTCCAQIPTAPVRSAFAYFLFKWEVQIYMYLFKKYKLDCSFEQSEILTYTDGL
jgi:hypothetical protein